MQLHAISRPFPRGPGAVSASRLLLVVAATALLGGCGGGDSNPADAGSDTGSDAGPEADASLADAGPCGQALLLSGEYVTWNSTPSDFAGIFDALWTEEGQPERTARTAPNGRGTLCVSGEGAVVRFEHPEYLPAYYTVGAAAGPFTAHGMALAELDTIFAAPLPARVEGAAQVMIEVRDAASAPVVGAQVEVAGGEQAFARAADGSFSTGAITTDAYVLVANVAVGDGTAMVTVTPPAGIGCRGPSAVRLMADSLSFATFICE